MYWKHKFCLLKVIYSKILFITMPISFTVNVYILYYSKTYLNIKVIIFL